MKFLLYAILILQPSVALAINYASVRITGPASKELELDASYPYFVDLLTLVLNKSAPANEQRKVVHQDYFVPDRQLKHLETANGIDLLWGGTSIEREHRFRAIRIPLLRGLLGYRVSLIHKDNIALFDSITRREELLKLHPCQGAGWPDTEILINAGFHVVQNSYFQGMFKQLNIKRCDLFPRGIFEASSEYSASRKEFPNLYLYKTLIIHYPFPMYFFVQKENTELASIIQKGFEKAIDDGSYENLLKTHKVTAHLFPIERWSNVRLIELHNPLLPKDTNTKDIRYWIQHPTPH